MVKKVLFVVNRLDFSGGEQKVLTQIAQELSKSNSVEVYSMKKSQQITYPLTDIKITYGIKKYTEPVRKALRAFEILENRLGIEQSWYTIDDYRQEKLLLEYIQNYKFDIVFFSGGHTYKYLSAIKKKLPNIRMYAWLHYSAEQDLSRKIKQNKEMMGVADGVISLTKPDADWIKKFTDRSYYIYNPVTIENIGCSSLEEKVISFVGRIDEKQKGVDLLVEVAKNLPEGWSIKVAGTGHDSAVRKFTKEIEDNSLSDRLIYEGFKSGKELQKHYFNSSIYLMTSRFEGFGLVLVEAMSYGLPIVAFDQQASRVVLENGRYGLIAKMEDIKDMSEKIKLLTDDVKLRKEYSRLSLERSQQFDMAAVIEKWTQLINNNKVTYRI
ncbi:glycosyltransferase [Sporolactobacillus terrae]|uniref:glycosyltransferase n=1 Tax=Sporolactobacillus terrae TaxID=269673 RepID=UPI001CBE19DB|nr:glycosyltransferase [Sporolactobacillus terrae]UAK16375.1 glycosyltransferase [Sporolactobacillus terrae]